MLHKKKSKQHKDLAKVKRDTTAVLTELEKNPLPDFELQVGDKNQEILNGDIQVRWCITEELIDILNDTGVIDPHILLISAAKGDCSEMSRQLIPLTQLKTFVRCTKAGDVTLHAWIINGSDGRKAINKKFLRKVVGRYDTDMLGYTGEGYTSGYEVAKYTSLPVVIPAGVFGKEPSPRMKKFANLWHSSKTVDECNYRQRLIVAFTIKWEAMIVYAIIAMVVRSALALFVAGIGYRKNVNWSIVLQVFEYDMADIFGDEYGGQFIDNDYIPRRTITTGYNGTSQYFASFVPLMPTFVAVILLIVMGVSNHDLFADDVILTCIILMLMVKITVGCDIIVAFALWCRHTSTWTHIDTMMVRIAIQLSRGNGLGWRIVNTIIYTTITILVLVGVYVYFDILQWTFLTFGTLIGTFLVGWMGLVFFSKLFTIDEKHNNINDVKELLCNDCDTAVLNGENRVVPFPSRQRRIKLFYLETKNKVCKPMQR